MIHTLAQRKADAAAAKSAAVKWLRPVLAAAAQGLGGRYLLYGSAARDALRHGSDVDLLLDFPDDMASTAAWDAAEAACAALDLPCDIRPLRWCDARFLAHVLPGAEPLG